MAQEPPHLEAFVKLGYFLREFCENAIAAADTRKTELQNVLDTAKAQNGWFTDENLNYCLKKWGDCLTEQNLVDWLTLYEFKYEKKPRTVGVIMAGNIPLVGFHDFLCVLFSGNNVLVKLSDNDKVLLPFLTKLLIDEDSTLSEKIRFVSGKLENFEVVIATGSNNTSRYFEYYFGRYPNLIRKNRNSVAVLTDNETPEQMKALGEDIFRYFGLGCRSVSTLFVPQGYEFGPLFQNLSNWEPLLENSRYSNNYDYNKAVYLMSDFKILDTGFLLLKEDEKFSSPIATLNYSPYSSMESLKSLLQEKKEELQCIVSDGFLPGEVKFGHTQSPLLNDYADGVDTLNFLKNL